MLLSLTRCQFMDNSTWDVAIWNHRTKNYYVCCGISACLTIRERWLRDTGDLSWSSLYKPARRNNLTESLFVQSIMLFLTSFSKCSYYGYTWESIPPKQKLMFTHTVSFGLFWSVGHLFCRHIYSSFESLTCKIHSIYSKLIKQTFTFLQGT